VSISGKDGVYQATLFMENNWTKANIKLPKSGAIVRFKVKNYLKNGVTVGYSEETGRFWISRAAGAVFGTYLLHSVESWQEL
jgi:hypothetical protein